jgi:transposase-like protein
LILLRYFIALTPAKCKVKSPLSGQREGVPQVAQDLGIAESQLYSWRAKLRQGGDSLEHQKLQQTEMAKLKRDIAHLAEENAFLKKWQCTSRKGGRTLCYKIEENPRADFLKSVYCT